MSGAPWSAEDSARVCAGYGWVPARTLAQQVGRSTSAVRNHAIACGVTTGARREWTLRELRFLRAHYAQRGAMWVCLQLRRSHCSVRCKVVALGLRRDYIAQGCMPNGTRPWLHADDERVMTDTINDTALARALGRSLHAVRVRRSKLRAARPQGP